jgi:hypothetical protein
MIKESQNLTVISEGTLLQNKVAQPATCFSKGPGSNSTSAKNHLPYTLPYPRFHGLCTNSTNYTQMYL